MPKNGIETGEGELAAVGMSIHRCGPQSSGARILAHHRRGRGPILRQNPFRGVWAGEPRGGRKEGAPALAGPVRHGSPGIGELGRRAVNVITPVFDLLLPLLRVAAERCLRRGESTAEEPLKCQGQKKLHQHDGQDKYQGNIKNHLGCNAAHRLGIDRAHSNNLRQALTQAFVRAGLEGVSDIDALDGRILPQRIERGRIGYLGRVEPREQIEIEHAARVDHQVSGAVLDIRPSIVHFARTAQAVECSPRIDRGMARVPEIVGNGQVGLARPILIERRAREIPGQVPLRIRRHVRVGCCPDESLAGAVDVLEEEAAILPPILVGKIIQDVLSLHNPSRRGMAGPFKIVRAPVKDHMPAIHPIDLETHPRVSADRLGEAKREEADESTDQHDDADQSHLFPPRSLLSLGRLPEARQHRTRAPKRHDCAVHIPQARWPHRIQLFLISLLLFRHRHWFLPPHSSLEPLIPIPDDDGRNILIPSARGRVVGIRHPDGTGLIGSVQAFHIRLV